MYTNIYHVFVLAADDENPLRKMGEQTEQKFERSQFGVGLPRSKKCEFDVERSGKLASTDSGNRHVFNGVECPTLSSLPAPTIRDISAKQRSSRDCIGKAKQFETFATTRCLNRKIRNLYSLPHCCID